MLSKSQSLSSDARKRIFGVVEPSPEAFLDGLDKLEEYLRTEPLRIVIVGETSTGKTTLINALIGEDFLSVATEPTTAVPVEVKYGDYFDLTAELPDGSTKSVHGNHIPDWAYLYGHAAPALLEIIASNRRSIKTFADQMTTGTAVATRMTMSLPLDVLHGKVVLVDTPGFNSPSKEHHRMAEAELRASHVQVMLASATQALKGTEIRFLNEQRLSKAVFAATQCDRLLAEVDEDELEDVLGDLKRDIEKSLSAPHALLFTSAKAALNGNASESGVFLDSTEALQKAFIGDYLSSRMLILWDGLELTPIIDSVARREFKTPQELAFQRRFLQRTLSLFAKLGLETPIVPKLHATLQEAAGKAQHILGENARLEAAAKDLISQVHSLDANLSDNDLHLDKLLMQFDDIYTIANELAKTPHLKVKISKHLYEDLLIIVEQIEYLRKLIHWLSSPFLELHWLKDTNKLEIVFKKPPKQPNLQTCNDNNVKAVLKSISGRFDSAAYTRKARFTEVCQAAELVTRALESPYYYYSNRNIVQSALSLINSRAGTDYLDDDHHLPAIRRHLDKGQGDIKGILDELSKLYTSARMINANVKMNLLIGDLKNIHYSARKLQSSMSHLSISLPLEYSKELSDFTSAILALESGFSQLRDWAPAFEHSSNNITVTLPKIPSVSLEADYNRPSQSDWHNVIDKLINRFIKEKVTLDNKVTNLSAIVGDLSAICRQDSISIQKVKEMAVRLKKYEQINEIPVTGIRIFIDNATSQYDKESSKSVMWLVLSYIVAVIVCLSLALLVLSDGAAFSIVMLFISFIAVISTCSIYRDKNGKRLSLLKLSIKRVFPDKRAPLIYQQPHYGVSPKSQHVAKPETIIASKQPKAQEFVTYSRKWHAVQPGALSPIASKEPIANGIVTLMGHSDGLWSVAFSPDGRFLATGCSDRTAKLWSVPEGKCLATLSRHSAPVLSVAFSPDGRYLATGSQDCTAKLWSVPDGKYIATLSGHSATVLSVAFSPDGRFLATSGDITATLFSVPDGKWIATFSGHSDVVWSVAFSPDGRYLATGSFDRTAKLWSVPSGRCIATLSGHSENVFSVAFSPDGRFLATGSYDDTTKLWGVPDGKRIATLSGHSESVLSIAFSPDGRWLATGGGEGHNTAKLWSVPDGKRIATFSGHSGSVWSVAFSPDGRYFATGCADCKARMWKFTLDGMQT